MATTGQKWLIGCGVGCGGVLLLALLGIFAVVFTVRGTVQEMEGATDTRDQLEQQVGPPNAYTPSPDGSIPADRLEAFLAVREATQDERKAIAESWEGLPMSMEQAREIDNKPVWEQLKMAASMVWGGFGLAGELGGFAGARNEALLEQQMTLGEYSYIYVLAYYSWLDHPVTDGPGKRADPAKEGEQDVGDIVGREVAREVYGKRVRKLLIEILEKQLAAVPQALGGEEAEVWRERLQAEIEALRENRMRTPWQEEMPAAIVASLEPYRERLEQSYEPTTNPFELARQNEQGGFSWQLE
jgi:hypothetical protein